MKILWFTNIPMPAVNEYFGKDPQGSGGWMGALLEQLKDISGLQLGVVTACPQFPNIAFRREGVEYFIVQQKWARLRRQFFPVDNNPMYIEKCAEIVDTFKPDLVHIHGTERFYGEMLCRGMLHCPVVFSLQGLMTTCCEWYRFFGKLSLGRILIDNILATAIGSGLILDYFASRRQANRERRYLQQGQFFFGRTEWDRATVKYYNNHAQYYCINRMIRAPFWVKKWSLSNCDRHRIIFTNARHPRKGTELLLAAVKKILPLYPNLKLVLIGAMGGRGYQKHLEYKAKELQGAVQFLGAQNAQAVTGELCKAHVFISASYIDNSPNSVAEAQLVGTPVISSYTGGVPSLVKDHEIGLLFPTGDVPLLVANIIRIFEDDRLAETLSRQARNIAMSRHDPASILSAQLAAYKDILT